MPAGNAQWGRLPSLPTRAKLGRAPHSRSLHLPSAKIPLMRPLALLLFAAALASAQPFKLEKQISLGDLDGRIDHLAIDLKTHRILLSALGSDSLMVIDVAGDKVLKSIGGQAEPQGTSYVPTVNRFYVANGKEGGKVHSYDAVTYKPTGEIGFGEDADNVRWDAAKKVLWVGYADGALASIDPATMKRTAPDIFIDGHPESFQLEKSGTRIFINCPDAREIIVLDREKRVILAKWPMTEFTKNFPMALDEPNHRVLVVSRKPAKLLSIDMETGKITSKNDCPGDSDDIFYDAARKRVYVAGGEGFLEAFQQNGPDAYQSLGKIKTGEGARTALFVADLNKIYLAVPKKPNQKPAVYVYTVN